MSHHVSALTQDKKVKPLMMNVATPSPNQLKEYKKSLFEDTTLVFSAKTK
jgi:hypothetical protein